MRLVLSIPLAKSLTQRRCHNAISSSSYSGFSKCLQHQSFKGSSQGQHDEAQSERSGVIHGSESNELNEERAGTTPQLLTERETSEQCQETDVHKDLIVDRIAKQNDHNIPKIANKDFSTDVTIQGKGRLWRNRLSRFEQYQTESDLSATQSHQSLLINEDLYANDWSLWLELIRFRKRHHGNQGAQALFKEIFRREMSLPTTTQVGRELWELSVMAGHQDSIFLVNIVSYAKRVKQSSGEAWSDLYYSILAHALKMDPTLAYDMHIRLKEHFPPSIGDYRRLFRLCASWENLNDFEGIYRDFPLPGLYATIIPELCKSQRYRDALKWHNLLFTFKDLPSVFAEIHPLLTYVVQRGDSRQLEQLVVDLRQAYGGTVSMPNTAERFVRKHNAIGREIFNRHMGEVHSVTPKHLSDDFCARLFATKLFSIDTVINGLQMMSVDMIGPLAMREIATRDDSDPIAICRHIDQLKDRGVTLDRSVFSTLMQKLALRGDKALLKSLTECDLHPDAFEDTNVQEQLLAQYYDRDDRLQFERTLAAICVRCKEQKVPIWRQNLTLRCLIALKKHEAVISTMQTMAYRNIPVTTRSSRYLRMCWLSQRRRGYAAFSTKELTIIINASISTLRSGGNVPIVAWKEILRRLGMASRLEELEALALWLVDFYTGSKIPNVLPVQMMLKQDQKTGFSSNSNPQAFLQDLFTIAGQHAIVAWGFHAEVKGTSKFRRIRPGLIDYTEKRPLWTWGLVLLRRLQARGVPIHESTVAWICTYRLRCLFGRGISNERVNRRSRSLNRWTLKYYIREIKKIWGKDLFGLEEEESLIRMSKSSLLVSN